MIRSAGVLGIGHYLPDELRTNDWWSAAIVDGWRPRGPRPTSAAMAEEELTDGMKKVLAAMAEYKDDPFHGAVQRHVMPADMRSSEMEIRAARQALAEAAVDPAEVDLILVHSVCPDHLNSPNACVVHQDLGLPESCFAMSTEGTMCNSFLMQLTLAEQLIASGRCRNALLVQSSALTHLAPMDENFAPWFGDGATAVVLGPVAEGRGILSVRTRTDGSLGKALVFGVPGKRWYDDGRVVLYSEDRAANRRMLLSVADMGRQIVHEALQAAGRRTDEVDFYGSHQATPWFRKVTQEHIGLHRARSVDTFAWAGSLSGANLPLVLATGQREGLLRDDDLVALYSGGSGITWSGAVLRWGR